MTSFNAYKRIVERAIDDSSDLGTRVSAEVDAAVMAATALEAGRHAKKAVRILQRNGRYATRADAALTGMTTKHQEVVDENLDLFNKNNDLQNENGGLLKRIFNWKMTAGALGLAATVFGIAYIAKPTTVYSAPTPAPIVRSVEEIVKPAVMPTAVENTDLYIIEARADGQYLKVRATDAEFKIPDGAKDTLVNYINKAEKYLANKGRLENGVHFYPEELKATLKDLYSKDAKSTYGAENKLVKQDIERATNRFEGE
jgi:hypothetical protein